MQNKYSSIELLYGILFFLVHLFIELVCYTLLYIKFSSNIATLVVVIYDFFAFVPQAIVGDFHNKHKNINIGIFGAICFVLALILIDSQNQFLFYLSLLFLSIGNAILHETGAIATISVSDNHIFPSSLFVSGGVFGILLARFLARIGISIYWLLLPIAFILVVVCLTSKDWCQENIVYTEFDIVKSVSKASFVLVVALVVVATRSFLGCILPTAWRRTMFDIVLLYFSLGVGKAVGGLLCDIYGYRFVTIISTLFCIPFIIFGNYNMLLSLVGILLFSMNMSITYALTLSIFKQNPGLAFGITTIGLFIGILPMFFVRIGFELVAVVLVGLSVVCYVLLDRLTKKLKCDNILALSKREC